uniref:Uncharacterized protein n=1 Tax=Meloidogyne javanica TaxID=6303 RepID=A0A915N8L3_MELJA
MNVSLLATFLFCIVASFCVIECMKSNESTGGRHNAPPSFVPRNPVGRLDAQGYQPNYGRQRGEITQQEINNFYRYRNINEGPHENQQNIHNNAIGREEVIDEPYPASDDESENTTSDSAYSGSGHHGEGSSHDVYGGPVYGQHEIGSGYGRHAEISSQDRHNRRTRPNNRNAQRSNNRNANQHRRNQREHPSNDVEDDTPPGYTNYSNDYRGN